MISDNISERLTELNIRFLREYSLKNASTFHIGGACELAVFPNSAEQLVATLCLLDENGVRTHLCGKGSNTLFFDGRLDMAVVFTSGVNSVEINDTSVICGAGVGLIPLASKACAEGLTGLEFASGIPGSVGGAVFMNAGAYGACMDSVVVSTAAYDRNTRRVLELTDHSFGYRESVYKNSSSLVCLEAKMLLREGRTEDIRERMRTLSEERRKKQPLEYPSAGSYFKRPASDFAGRLIEICGLKGERIGDACVSDKHAGFIVNLGDATFDDVIRLEERVRDTVYRQTGVMLEREVEMIK